VRQAEPVRGRLLGASDENRGNDPDLAVYRPIRGASTSRSPAAHASRLAAASHSARPSIEMV
jgi:hypothetical protein